MKLVRPLSLALAVFAVAAPRWAAQHDQHKPQHPAGSASVAAKSMPAKTTPEMARMVNQTKAMQEMHDKMMATNTPDERSALMADHMKTLQDGMGMMKGMGGMTVPERPPAGMSQRQSMMEQRMDMMQAMMEMMADRLPQTPARP